MCAGDIGRLVQGVGEVGKVKGASRSARSSQVQDSQRSADGGAGPGGGAAGAQGRLAWVLAQVREPEDAEGQRAAASKVMGLVTRARDQQGRERARARKALAVTGWFSS